MDPMIDYGRTSDYVLMAINVHLAAIDYLGVDWDSDLGKRLREVMDLAAQVEPDMVVLNDFAS